MKTTDYIGMYQQGGPAQLDPKQKLVALVQAAMSGDQAATQQIQQIMQAAQQGDPKAQQLAQAIQQIAQAMEQQAQIAKEGAKLEYIHTLRCGGKTKKKEEGGLIDLEKCGGKTKKKVTKKATCGCKLKKVGGRIVEVDGCTELPIHQQGGYIVPKAQVGLAQGLKKDYLTQMTEAPLPGGATTHNYYNAQTGKMQTGTWDAAGKKWNYTDMNNTESAAFLANKNNFNEGFEYDPNTGTGIYDTKENALTGMGDAYTYDKSNTSRYGFTVSRDNTGAVKNIEKGLITGATLGDNAERTARQALRQDRRDLRAYARQYGKYYDDGNGNTGRKAMKEALGLGTGKTVKQMMNGEGSGWLGQRASSVNSGIQTAGSYLASQSTADLNSPGSTKVAATNEKSDKTPVSNVSKPVITKTNIGNGSLSFKIGGLLKKFQFGGFVSALTNSNPTNYLEEDEELKNNPYNPANWNTSAISDFWVQSRGMNRQQKGDLARSMIEQHSNEFISPGYKNQAMKGIDFLYGKSKPQTNTNVNSTGLNSGESNLGLNKGKLKLGKPSVGIGAAPSI